MVVNIIEKHLKEIGFTEYEAKAWIALLRGHPRTPYEVAKESGIPTSKIYEVLSRLEIKDAVTVTRRGKKRLYLPRDHREVLQQKRESLEATFDSLEQDLAEMTPEKPVSFVWNMDDYDFCMEKAREIAAEAVSTLLVSGWKEELLQLKEILTARDEEGLSIATVHFGTPEFSSGQQFQHPIEETLQNEKGGRGFVIVADTSVALMATVQEDNLVHGAWSDSSGFVLLAEDYIKHDVYIMKIVRRFDGLLKERFGENYRLLRDVFNDEEII